MITLKANEFKNCKNKEEERKRARFFNTLSGIKTPFLVGTEDKNGYQNLAIFSSVFHLGANPPLMGMIFRPTTVERHTYENILENKYYSLNCVPYSLAKNAHLTSARFSKEESEFDACEFTAIKRGEFSCPHVFEAPISWTMKYIRFVEIPENGTLLLIGEVQEVYIEEKYLDDDGQVLYEKSDPLLCVGLDHYLNLEGNGKRLPYAKPHMRPKII